MDYQKIAERYATQIANIKTQQAQEHIFVAAAAVDGLNVAIQKARAGDNDALAMVKAFRQAVKASEFLDRVIG